MSRFLTSNNFSSSFNKMLCLGSFRTLIVIYLENKDKEYKKSVYGPPHPVNFFIPTSDGIDVGVTCQPLHFAPSIEHFLYLISILFRRPSASFPVFMCRDHCTPSIDRFRSEHQTPRHLAPTFMFCDQFCFDNRAPRVNLLQYPCPESILLRASSLSFS